MTTPRHTQWAANVRGDARAAQRPVLTAEFDGVLDVRIRRIHHHGHPVFGSGLGEEAHGRILQVADLRAPPDPVVPGEHLKTRQLAAVGLFHKHPAFAVPRARHGAGGAAAVENRLASHQQRRAVGKPQPQRHRGVGMIPREKETVPAARDAHHRRPVGGFPAVHRKGIAKRGQHVAHKLFAREPFVGRVGGQKPPSWPVMVRVGSADPRQHTAVPFGQLPRQGNHAAAGVALDHGPHLGVRIASIGQDGFNAPGARQRAVTGSCGHRDAVRDVGIAAQLKPKLPVDGLVTAQIQRGEQHIARMRQRAVQKDVSAALDHAEEGALKP